VGMHASLDGTRGKVMGASSGSAARSGHVQLCELREWASGRDDDGLQGLAPPRARLGRAVIAEELGDGIVPLDGLVRTDGRHRGHFPEDVQPIDDLAKHNRRRVEVQRWPGACRALLVTA